MGVRCANVVMFYYCSMAIDVEFIWIRAAMRLLVITVNCFNAYRNRKAVHNAFHTIYKSSLLTTLCNAQLSHTHSVSTDNNSVLMISLLIGWRKPADTIDQWFRLLPVHLSSPVMTICYDQERCSSQIHVNTCQ